jgi:predicted amidophosphoribosyltransferase
MCARCGRPFPTAPAAESAQPTCRPCQDSYCAFDSARSEEVTRLGDWFAAGLAEVVAHEREQFGADVIVPVPLHPDRQRESGHNQAELSARRLARRLHLKQGAYLLVRTKPRPAGLVLSRKDHRDSARGAYATREGLRVDKLRVLLVDDVVTTGATLDWCARALKSAGPVRFWGWRLRECCPNGRPRTDRNRGKQSQGRQTNKVRRASLPAPKELIKRRKGGAHG